MKVRFLMFLVLSVAAGVSLAAWPEVTLEITGGVAGDIVLELYTDKAPITVANFIDYVQSGFYDDLIFHRVVNGFVIQGGGFGTNMVEKVPGPPIINESSNALSNLRSTVAMARTSDPHSATSQFFINLVDNIYPTVNNLDYGSLAYAGGEPYVKVGYCVFGRVVSGMDIVDAIALVTTTDGVPDIDIIIHSARVTFVAPVCAEKLPGDINGDCKIDLADYLEMAQNWVMCNSITPTCVSP